MKKCLIALAVAGAMSPQAIGVYEDYRIVETWSPTLPPQKREDWQRQGKRKAKKQR